MKHSYKLFWDWFLENLDSISRIYNEVDFIKELNTEIDKLGNFTWEVGGGKKKTFSFTISPGGDSTLLEESKEIISHAPPLPEWEFYNSKQPKEWKGYFETELNGKTQRIDVSKWEYVLYRFEDGSLDIVVRPVPFIVDSENEVYGIVEMVLDSIIGEEKRIKNFENLEIVKDFDIQFQDKTSFILNLEKHLTKIG